MSTTLEEIRAIANDRRLKPGPMAGLVWARVNCTRPPTGTQLAREMGVCRNTAESWLRAWERYGYLFRLPSQASDGTWSWRRFFPDHSTDAQKVSIQGSTRSKTRRKKSSSTYPPSQKREVALNAQKVSNGATSDDAENVLEEVGELMADMEDGRQVEPEEVQDQAKIPKQWRIGRRVVDQEEYELYQEAKQGADRMVAALSTGR